VIAQLGVGDEVLRVATQIVGIAALATGLGGAIGLLHRWYARLRVPEGLAILVGVSGVSIYLNAIGITTIGALEGVIGGDLLPTTGTVLFNVAVFGLAAVAAAAGGRAGDRLGEAVFGLAGANRIDTDVSTIVRSVGRSTALEIPPVDDIGDAEGYDPLDEATKAAFADQTLLFPRRLTIEELRRRLVERLRIDYGVGYVDVELTADGTVEYLAVGSREAGLGPTLPPGSAAVAVHADPAFAASAGDSVLVYRPTPEGPERVCLAEVRGVAGDVVTLAVDATEAPRFDDGTHYRLATLPVEARPDREFVSLLRAAEETMGVVTVAEDGALASVPVGSLEPAVVAVRSADGVVEAIPGRSRVLDPGDSVYVVARPALLRRLEAAATGAPPVPRAERAAADDD
jgi:hypothetical protein